MRSPETDAAFGELVARNPGLPLDTMLDDNALSRWLSDASGLGGRTRRRYTRLKPGANALVLAERSTVNGTDLVMVLGATGDAVAKLHKSRAKAAAGTVLADDPGRRLLALTPSADRRIPGLRAMATDARAVLRRMVSDVREPELTTLSYKPYRRWVARLRFGGGDPLLVRAYRSGHLARNTTALRALQESGLPVPRLLGERVRQDLVVCSWTEGQVVETLLDDPARLRTATVAAGQLLARLHGTERRLPASGASTIGSVTDAVAALGAVLPAVGRMANQVAVRLRSRLTGDTATLIHGDFSLDQVVLGADGPALLDLDRTGGGPRAADLGSAAAAVAMQPGHADLTAPVLDWLRHGYQQVGPVPGDDEVADHLAAQLVQRSLEPFRTGAPDWAERARHAVQLAQRLQSEGLAALAPVRAAS